jgi:hypothetical protein
MIGTIDVDNSIDVPKAASPAWSSSECGFADACTEAIDDLTPR